MNNTGIVFLTGAGFDGSIWQDVTSKIELPFVVVEYPERHNGKKAQELSFDDYIKSAMAQIQKLGTEKIVIVGHSIGGVVMMRLGELLKEQLAGRIAIAAAIPASDGSFLSCLPQPKRLIMGIILKLAGTEVPPSAIRSSLCSDLTDSQSKSVIDNFTAESRDLYTASVRYEAHFVPGLYVVTTKDPEFTVAWQKTMAKRLQAETVEVPTGHLPMIGRPSDVLMIIEAFMKKL